jgi:hypothetical protein
MSKEFWLTLATADDRQPTPTMEGQRSGRSAHRAHQPGRQLLIGAFYTRTQIIQQTIAQIINPAMNSQILPVFPGAAHHP